jgi:hypothetical protein
LVVAIVDGPLSAKVGVVADAVVVVVVVATTLGVPPVLENAHAVAMPPVSNATMAPAAIRRRFRRHRWSSSVVIERGVYKCQDSRSLEC